MQKKARVVVLDPDNENLSSSDAIWLPGAVRNRIESNLGTYTDFILVDRKNERSVKQLQKKSETSSFDSATAIEIGKLTSAQHAIFSIIRKTGSTYSLNCDFTNLTTGEKKVFLISGKKTLDEIFNSAGCAADEITLKICESSGISLTASQRYTLMHGDSAASYAETLKQMQEEENSLMEMMSSLDSKLKSLSSSTELSASAKIAKIEAEKAITQEKLKSAQQKKEKRLEEERKKSEDAIADQNRSLRQKQRRDQMAKKAAEQASAVRKAVLETSSIISQINTIEAKKSALVEIRENVDVQVKESNESFDSEMKEKIREIENQPFRNAELEKGVPTEFARNNRKEKIRKLKEDYETKAKNEEKNIRNSTVRQEQSLFSEIQADYKVISKRHTISSLGNDLRYNIGEYSGKSMSWPVTVYFYSNNIFLYKTEINLKYSDLTGENSIPSYGSEYDAYLDTVDLYESLFRRGDPILAFEMDFSVEPLPDEYPSHYEFRISAIRAKNMDKGKFCLEENLKVSFVREFVPAYDIRKKDEQAKLPGKSQKQEKERKIKEQEQARKQQAEKSAAHKKAKMAAKAAREDRYSDFSPIFNIKAGPFFSSGDFDGFDMQMNLNIVKSIFCGFSLGTIKSPESISKFVESEYLFDLTATLGVNYRIPILYYPPNIYAMCGFGGAFGKTVEKWKSSSSSSSGSKEQGWETASYGFIKPAVGIEIPLFRHFAVYGQGNLNCIIEEEVTFDFEIGASINF